MAAGRTKLITNAGGINPTAAARAAIETAKQLGLSGLRIATVLGDDLKPRLEELRDAGTSLENSESGAGFDDFPGEPLFCVRVSRRAPDRGRARRRRRHRDHGSSGRRGAVPRAAAHAHGWKWDDWDRLAAGTLIGHLLECSGQVAGGNYSGEWWTIPHPWDLPYPIAEVEPDGTAVITKPEASGGRVDFDTVRHQLLYEVHDPAAYLSPDVVADFTSAAFTDLGSDRVRVEGRARRARNPDVQGVARVPRRLVGRGPRRVLLAGRVREGEGHGRALREAGRDGRARRRRVVLRVWGVNTLGGRPVPPPTPSRPRCVHAAAWRCADERTRGVVGRELIPLTLSAPPAGLTGMGRQGGGRPNELLGIWPTLVDRKLVDEHVRVTFEEVRDGPAAAP